MAAASSVSLSKLPMTAWATIAQFTDTQTPLELVSKDCRTATRLKASNLGQSILLAQVIPNLDKTAILQVSIQKMREFTEVQWKAFFKAVKGTSEEQEIARNVLKVDEREFTALAQFTDNLSLHRFLSLSNLWVLNHKNKPFCFLTNQECREFLKPYVRRVQEDDIDQCRESDGYQLKVVVNINRFEGTLSIFNKETEEVEQYPLSEFGMLTPEFFTFVVANRELGLHFVPPENEGDPILVINKFNFTLIKIERRKQKYVNQIKKMTVSLLTDSFIEQMKKTGAKDKEFNALKKGGCKFICHSKDFVVYALAPFVFSINRQNFEITQLNGLISPTESTLATIHHKYLCMAGGNVIKAIPLTRDPTKTTKMITVKFGPAATETPQWSRTYVNTDKVFSNLTACLKIESTNEGVVFDLYEGRDTFEASSFKMGIWDPDQDRIFKCFVVSRKFAECPFIYRDHVILENPGRFTIISFRNQKPVQFEVPFSVRAQNQKVVFERGQIVDTSKEKVLALRITTEGLYALTSAGIVHWKVNAKTEAEAKANG